MAVSHFLLCPSKKSTGTGILVENKDGIMCFVVASVVRLYVLVFSNEVVMNH